MKHLYYIVGVALLVVSCSSDPKTDATNKTQRTVRASMMKINSSSTFTFAPTTLTSKSEACGVPTAVDISLTETAGSRETIVSIHAQGSALTVGKVYRDADRNGDPRVSLDLTLANGGAVSHSMQTEPNDVRTIAVRFDELTPSTFAVSFALTTYGGKTLSGSASGSFEPSSCEYGQAERRVGYDSSGEKKVCYIQPDAPVPAIGCVPSSEETRFLNACRATGKRIVNCGVCEDYCSAPLLNAL